MYLLPGFVKTRVEEDVEGEAKSFQNVFVDVYFLQIGTKLLLLLLFFPLKLRRTNKQKDDPKAVVGSSSQTRMPRINVAIVPEAVFGTPPKLS